MAEKQDLDRVSRSLAEAMHEGAHPKLHAAAVGLVEAALNKHPEDPTAAREALGITRYSFERLRRLYFPEDRRAYKADGARGMVSPNLPNRKRKRAKK